MKITENKIETFGLQESKIKSIELAFAPKTSEREALSIIYNNVIKLDLEDDETSVIARDLRLKLRKIRVDIKNIHKREKAFSLAYGKLVDAWKNKETTPVEIMEEKLIEMERYAEVKERKRLDVLQITRQELLKPFIDKGLELDLSNMDQDVFDSFLSTRKKITEDRIEAERIESEKQAKKERLEKQEQERIRLENEALRKELKEKEDRQKIEDEKRAILDKKRIEKEIIEAEKLKIIEANKQAELNAKIEAEKAEKERVLKIERDKTEVLNRKLNAKIEAENREKQIIEEQKQIELSKGDEDKVNDLLNDLATIKLRYLFDSKSNKKMYEEVGILLTKIIHHVKK